MSVRFIDGFDLCVGVGSGNDNSLSMVGWSGYNVSGASTLEYQRGLSGGRRLSLGSSVHGYSQVYKTLLWLSDLSVGFSLACECNGSTTLDQAVLIYADASTSYVSFDISGGQYLTINFHPSGESIDFGYLGKNITHYFEVEIVSGVAKIYRNNLLISENNIGAAQITKGVRFRSQSDSSSSTMNYIYIDDVVIINYDGSGISSRPGPISLVPLLPVALGSVNSMSQIPASGEHFDKVDDSEDTVWNTGHTDYLYGGNGKEERFLCSANLEFAGTALGYIVAGAVKAAGETDMLVNLFAAKGGSELASADAALDFEKYTTAKTDFLTALPDGSPMTTENLEATEFGLRVFLP